MKKLPKSYDGKPTKLGAGGRFAMVANAGGAGKKGAAIAAAAGRKKYGAKKFAALGATGKKKK